MERSSEVTVKCISLTTPSFTRKATSKKETWDIRYLEHRICVLVCLFAMINGFLKLQEHWLYREQILSFIPPQLAILRVILYHKKTGITLGKIFNVLMP